MTTARSKDTAIKEVTAQGRTRYRVVADTGFHPDGRRRQTSKTFDTRKEAKDWLAKTRTEVRDGGFVAPDRTTVADVIDAWLEGKKRKIRPSTQQCYRVSLSHARAALGHLPAQKVTQRDVDRLIDHLLTERLPNGQQRSPRTVALMVGLLKSVFTYAQRQKIVTTNPVAYVEPIEKPHREMQCWTEQQRSQWLAHARDDQYAAGWCLTGIGLRRGEVLGLRWEDVTLDGPNPSIKIRRTRGESDGQVREGDPKSARSRRTLLLSGLPQVVALLRATKQAQVEGAVVPLTARQDGYVVADALGRPLHPSYYSKRFTTLCRDAKVPVIRLHDARHTSVSLMLARGIPVHTVAKWHGHDPKMTYSVYAHSDEEQMAEAGAALAL